MHWGVLRWGGHWLEPAGVRLPPLEVPEAVHKIYPDLVRLFGGISVHNDARQRAHVRLDGLVALQRMGRGY